MKQPISYHTPLNYSFYLKITVKKKPPQNPTQILSSALNTLMTDQSLYSLLGDY